MSKQDELLLTPEEIREIYGILDNNFPYIGGKDKRMVALRQLCELFEAKLKAQLAKAKPIIEKQADIKWIKALMTGGITVSKPEQLEGMGDRIEKRGRERIGEILVELGWGRAADDLFLYFHGEPETIGQALKGD